MHIEPSSKHIHNQVYTGSNIVLHARPHPLQARGEGLVKFMHTFRAIFPFKKCNKLLSMSGTWVETDHVAAVDGNGSVLFMLWNALKKAILAI